MRQTITLSDTWFEIIETIADIQQVKTNIEQLVQSGKDKSDMVDSLVELCDVELAEALAGCTKLLFRSQDMERYVPKKRRR